MLCEKNMQILDEEIRKLEEKELNWQTCDKLCMLYNLRQHMEHACKKDAEYEHHLTREQAIEWVSGMHGEDPAVPSGGKWTPEQVKPYAQKQGVKPDGEPGLEFWAVMNAMYSDYYDVAKRYNVASPDFFADMAKAFLTDKDALEGKAERYYKSIVRK